MGKLLWERKLPEFREAFEISNSSTIFLNLPETSKLRLWQKDIFWRKIGVNPCECILDENIAPSCSRIRHVSTPGKPFISDKNLSNILDSIYPREPTKNRNFPESYLNRPGIWNLPFWLRFACFGGPWWAMNPLGSLSPQKTNHPNKTNPSEWLHGIFLRGIHKWLVVSTHLKNISQIGNLPQIGVKMKNIWNHHLDNLPHEFSYDSWRVHEGFTQAGGSQLWHRAWKIWKSLMGFFTRGVEERSWIFSVVFMSSSIYIYKYTYHTHTHICVCIYKYIYICTYDANAF